MFILIVLWSNVIIAQKKLVVKFENMANGRKVDINNDWYKEGYSITKLKYYISNINIVTTSKRGLQKNVFLIDASKDDSIVLASKKGNITGISFLVGVDSAYHYSGPQQGALDPLNDMFWTWNNGYVVFKLDGQFSKAAPQKLEYHIGGYKGVNKTDRQLFLPIKKWSNTITIQMNVDELWSVININDTKIITSPGPLAKKVADNFVKMFIIKNEN